ncbi:MAG: hypothetical protein HOC20_03635 [Chloroflexi bacterium]|nr:hypothetical protein [Chloroflexota bacterium]
MKIHKLAMVVILGIMIVAGISCDEGSEESAESAGGTPISTPSPTIPASPTETVTPTPTAEPTPPPTPVETISLEPTIPPTPGTPTAPSGDPPECDADRAAIKVALDAYHAENGVWPTADGQPAAIDWDKLVPDYLEGQPSTQKCKWRVSADPVGEVCRPTSGC